MVALPEQVEVPRVYEFARRCLAVAAQRKTPHNNNNKIIVRIYPSINIRITMMMLLSLTKRQFKLLVDLDCSNSTVCHNFIKCQNHHDPTVLDISPTQPTSWIVMILASSTYHQFNIYPSSLRLQKVTIWQKSSNVRIVEILSSSTYHQFNILIDLDCRSPHIVTISSNTRIFLHPQHISNLAY